MPVNSKTEKKAKANKKPYHHGDLRAALLSAARDELDENGIEKFSLRGVAKRAGVSHAAPAHHFSDTGGLLTALAAQAHELFVESQLRRQARAAADPASQLIAAALGYVDFATRNQALFQLIFSSHRPDFDDPELSEKAGRSFGKLVKQIAEVSGRDPCTDETAMIDLIALWALVHGVADLMNGQRLKPLEELSAKKQQEIISEVVARVLPDPPGQS